MQRPSVTNQIRADQVGHAYSKLPVALWGTVAAATFLFVVEWAVIRHSLLLGWYGAIWAVTAARLWLLLNYRREQPGLADTEWWASRFFAGVLAAAVVWGAAGILLFPAGDVLHQVFLAAIFAGLTAGSSTMIAAMWGSVVAFLCLVLLPVTVRFLVVGDQTHLLMGAMSFVFLLALLQSAKVAHDTLRETFNLRADVVSYRDQLRHSEASRRSLVDNLPVGLFRCATNFEGEFAFANPSLARLLGYGSPDALASVTIASRFTDTKDFERIVAEVAAHGSLQGEECRLKRKNGEEIWGSLSGATVATENEETEEVFDGVLEDITDHMEGRQALRDAHDRLDALLTALPDVMFEVSTGGRIYAMRSPDAALGHASPRDVVGKRIVDVMPPDAAAVITAGIEEAAENGRHVGGTYSLDTDGGTRWFELWIARKGRAEDPQVRLVVLVRDITERKTAG